MAPKDKARAYRLKRLYNITIAQYDKMLELQGGKCFICSKQPKEGKRLHIDHDHKSGRARGLLCWFCNKRVLGKGLDNAALHRMAAIYLEREGKPGKLFDGREI